MRTDSREPARVPTLLSSVSRNEAPERRRSRAARLQREAANCLGVAVTTAQPEFAAELIDEAIKLTKRSQEMADTD